MSRDRIHHMINGIIDREGGYVDNLSDRGGPTNFGITQKTLSNWIGKPATKADVLALPRETAFKIYWRRYVVEPHFDCIHNDHLAEQVVDCGALHSQARAARWLQRAVGIKSDGIIGPVTLKAVNEGTFLPEEMGRKIAVQRIRFMGQIINRNYKARKKGLTKRDQSQFAEGWLNRATEFL